MASHIGILLSWRVSLYIKGWLDEIIPVIPSSSGVLCREQTLSSLCCLPQHTFTAGQGTELEEGWGGRERGNEGEREGEG